MSREGTVLILAPAAGEVEEACRLGWQAQRQPPIAAGLESVGGAVHVQALVGREVVVVGHDSVQRRIAPACAQPGATHTHVAAELGVSPPTVATWRRRFIEHGPAGLTDEPRPGRYAGHRQVTAGAADDAGHARTAHPRLQSAPAPAGTARAPGFPVCLCWEPVRGRLKRAGILVSEAAHNYRGRPHA